VLRYAQVLVLVRIAIALGLLIARSPWALAVDNPSGVYQRLQELRDRGQALQSAARTGQVAFGFSRGFRPTMMAQMSAPQGASPPPTCYAKSSGACLPTDGS
jgi:hypothetical protein